MGWEIIDEAVLDGSEVNSGVEEYCDRSHSVTGTRDSMILWCSRQSVDLVLMSRSCGILMTHDVCQGNLCGARFQWFKDSRFDEALQPT
jgi:hypothetical protein